jgi:hypothetical protein
MMIGQTAILGGFALCVFFLGVAFATGRAYFAVPMLYVERRNSPVAFWIAVAMWASALAIGIAVAVAGRW